MKVLIVDDSRAMRMIIKRTLRQAGLDGHTLEEASGGQEALKKIDTFKPDLVLSDWHMPDMDGITLLRNIQSTGLGVPFGFVTSQGTREMRKLAEEAGALFLIAKPFTPEIFQQTLSRYLG